MLELVALAGWVAWTARAVGGVVEKALEQRDQQELEAWAQELLPLLAEQPPGLVAV